MARSITGECGALHTLRVIKSDWTAVYEKRRLCSGSFYQSCLSSEQRQRGPAASLFLHMHIFKNKQLAGCLQAHTHYHIHTHAPSCRHVGEWTQTHKLTGQRLITRIFTWLTVHIQTHIHTVTHQCGTSTPSHRKHRVTHSSCFPMGDIHNFLINIFLWSLQAHSTSEHNKRDYTIHKWRMRYHESKVRFSNHSILYYNTVTSKKHICMYCTVTTENESIHW